MEAEAAVAVEVTMVEVVSMATKVTEGTLAVAAAALDKSTAHRLHIQGS